MKINEKECVIWCLYVYRGVWGLSFGSKQWYIIMAPLSTKNNCKVEMCYEVME